MTETALFEICIACQSEDHARASELEHSGEEKVSGTLPETVNEGTTCTNLQGAEMRVTVD